ncbi:hypothetical protein CFP56_021377 [Quercus suber]|uniref:Uncharacterized protein n=1 Tax=Quercus suber TaxID=58331 RepID=A0AAW0KER0_QUESU
MSELENGISDTQTVSRQLQYGQGDVSFSTASQGEESFSAVGTLSSLINFSGPVTYSGSVSLRSDSSTTSTRSFAFPVVAIDVSKEWNYLLTAALTPRLASLSCAMESSYSKVNARAIVHILFTEIASPNRPSSLPICPYVGWREKRRETLISTRMYGWKEKRRE